MKRTIALGLLSASLLGLASAGNAPAAATKLTHCANVRYPPLYLTIKRVTEKGAGCTVARGVALAYMHATTSSTGSHAHTGHCFGAHSYGACKVRYRKQVYDCFHFNVVPEKTRGLVRCTHAAVLVKFNIGS